jgi:hypothetical protein
MAEIMFEEFHVPAFYIANNAVLSAFAAGKGTALIVDIGKTNASVVPVSDGFVLRKGISVSPLPPQVHSTAHRILTNPSNTPGNPRPPIQLIPHQLIASKTAVEINQPPQIVLREDRKAGTTDSWRTWAEEREVEEWLHGVGAVFDQGWNEQLALSAAPKHYEFPTGANALFGRDRFIPGENYFNQPSNPTGAQRFHTIPHLIANTLQSCEPDIRATFLANVVLTGGGSLMPGISHRLENELLKIYQSQKIKLHSPGNLTERRYSAWLGGSILASLGTFHQLWISAEEWKEHGRAIVGQRCK